jgi:tetratricopeptide (TPR) repeat protein
MDGNAEALAHFNRAYELQSHGDRAGALVALDDALKADPDSVEAHCNRALLLLATGDYPRGWQEFEWRWRRSELQTIRDLFAREWWSGGSLAGRTILLFAEQGYGDAIQFARYAPLVARMGARVVLDCHPPLQALFRNVEGVSAVLASDAEIADYELCAPLMSLPRLLGTSLATIPADIPYLRAAPEAASRWRERMGGAGVRVGLVWASNPSTGHAWQKSLPPEALAPLTRVRGTTFYSLQTDLAPLSAAEACGFPVVDLSAELGDFSATAALIANLDLVISVDTAVAHLAGAMGKAVWTLLPQVADWRWEADARRSPWYPSMRLFRQRREGDWESVVEEVGDELKKLEPR